MGSQFAPLFGHVQIRHQLSPGTLKAGWGKETASFPALQLYQSYKPSYT